MTFDHGRRGAQESVSRKPGAIQIHLLRRARKAITATQLAETLEVAPRTVYRDVAALMAMGVPIDGAAGVGYIMRPGHDLPPLMFDREEVEAVAVGLQLVNRTGDPDLQAAARRVAAKIASVLPELRADELDDGRFVVSGYGTPTVAAMGMLRSAVRDNRRLALVYRDERERVTERTCLPLAVIYTSRSRCSPPGASFATISATFAPTASSPAKRRATPSPTSRRSCDETGVPGGACPARTGTEVSARAFPNPTPLRRETAASSLATAASAHDAVTPAVPVPGQQQPSASGRVWKYRLTRALGWASLVMTKPFSSSNFSTAWLSARNLARAASFSAAVASSR